MKPRALLLLSLSVRCLSSVSFDRPPSHMPRVHAQASSTTTDVLDPARRIDWSQAGVPGGIPDRATGTCATLGPDATASEINSALAACGSGVVYLDAGTYNLSAGITFRGLSNVTLSGAGPAQTILKFTGSDPCGGLHANVCIRGWSGVWSGNVPAGDIRNWTAGYGKGSTQITLDSTAGLTVGSVIVLDQLNDTVDEGAAVVSDAIGQFSLEGGAPGRANRAQQQFVQVTAIDGDRVTISPGLHMPNWRDSQQPQAWWWGETAVLNGVEDLTLDHSASSETVRRRVSECVQVLGQECQVVECQAKPRLAESGRANRSSRQLFPWDQDRGDSELRRRVVHHIRRSRGQQHLRARHLAHHGRAELGVGVCL